MDDAVHIARALGGRQDGSRIKLHGADGRLGSAGSVVLHPMPSDAENGALSADGRPVRWFHTSPWLWGLCGPQAVRRFYNVD